MNYEIGQVLIANQDIEVERGITGVKDVIRTGTKAYVGADRFAHHENGFIRSFPESASIAGYDVDGIAEWILNYVYRQLPLDIALEEAKISHEEFKEYIAEALQELGFYSRGDRHD